MTSELQLKSHIERIKQGLICITTHNSHELIKLHSYLTSLGLKCVGQAGANRSSVYYTVVSWKDKQYLVDALVQQSYGLTNEEFVAAVNVLTKPYWVVNVFGKAGSKSFEISVVRSDNEHGMKSFGWFDGRKLLITHNGGPCDWPLTTYVWDEQIRVAGLICKRLNNHEIPWPETNEKDCPKPVQVTPAGEQAIRDILKAALDIDKKV